MVVFNLLLTLGILLAFRLSFPYGKEKHLPFEREGNISE